MNEFYVIGTGAYNAMYYFIDVDEYDKTYKCGNCYLLYKAPENLPKNKTGKESLNLHNVRPRYRLPMSS